MKQQSAGDIRAPGESVLVGRKNPERRATGRIPGDSGRHSQTGEAKKRALAERNVLGEAIGGLER